MLSDERFPIVATENSEAILLRLLELESLVGDIRQVSFAVHDIDEKEFHWSLFVRAESEVLEKIQIEMLGIDGQLKKTVQPVDNATPPVKLKNVEENPDEPGFTDLGWAKTRRVEEWLVLSNHVPFLDGLADRVSNKSARSLGKSRKYEAIKKIKSRLSDRDGLVTIYGNPVRMRYFFPYQTQEEWDLLEIDEMPACGLKFVITDSLDEDQSQPIVLADAVVKFTQPAAGQSRMFQAYRSVEVPPLAVEPIELLAFARDEAAVYAESARLFDAQHGQGASEKKLINQFKAIGLENWKDAIARRQALYEMRFINEKHTADRPGLVSMERLRDSEFDPQFASAVTRFANNQHRQKLSMRVDGPNVFWTVPTEQFEQNSGLRGFDRRRNSSADFYFFNAKYDAYALADDWWVQGDMPAVQDQVNLLTEGEADDCGQPIRNLVEDLTRRLGSEDQPFMIKYFTKDAWQENLNNVEQQYANSNTHPVEFKLKFTQRRDNIVLELDPDAKNAGGNGSGTIEIQLSGIQIESSDGTLVRPNRLNLDNLSTLQMMMPMKLIDRNEDGHRIELKKREDLETAIRVMILKSISETFPRQLFLYTQNENHIRIMIGAYPELTPEGKE